MALELIARQGDITHATVDAIVNAANNKFWMGSGVAGAIKAAGGQVVEDEAINKGPVMPGEAVYTTAGRLRFKCIIHAAVMGQDLRTSDKLIRKATVSSLNLAEKLKLKSIALPAFGTGVGGFPIPACAKLMVTTVRGFSGIAETLERVELWLFDANTFALFQKQIGGKDG